MGGNALGATRPRLSRQDYNEVVTELKALLVPRFYAYVEQPRSFASKTSFGDVDLLATLPCTPLDPLKDVASTASSANGNILSFEFRGFQIDIIQGSSLNYDYWRQGFQTQEEMFRFIQSSKYFQPSFFSRQNPEVLELDALKRTKGSKVFESPTI
ncbi:hypothetical protein WJX82_009869 [Trebouxia sp. C0006]